MAILESDVAPVAPSLCAGLALCSEAAPPVLDAANATLDDGAAKQPSATANSHRTKTVVPEGDKESLSKGNPRRGASNGSMPRAELLVLSWKDNPYRILLEPPTVRQFLHFPYVIFRAFFKADADVGSLTGERTGFSFIVGNMLFFLTSSSIVAGLGLGFLTRNTEGAWTRRHVSYMEFPGELFLRLAGVVVIPSLTSMLVASVVTAGLAAARRMGLLAFAFYFVSKAMAMTVAYGLAVAMNPDISLEGQTPTIRRVNIPNYVGMTVVSVLLGAVLATMWESCRGFIELFVAISDVMLNLGRMIMWYFPIGICFLLTSQTLRSQEFVSETRQLESYFLSLVLALAIHGMLTLPVLLIVFSRTHYRSLFSNIGLTLVTAFGTSSSNMTLTSTVSSLEDKVGLNPVVVRLVAPLGATFNKDGTAIYLVINTVFLAQRSGYHVTFLDFLATR
ncbi:neutral amino acid transporter B(0) [Rhipicephalus sanguineus]|uniref:neutral amino acid transporter B(0) n=1 Tax=Rhipicephalus sanguineus TaxID=34632 RepID=UPI0020C3695F|nr:neutral amino acid transporter B(0) [Rhipicephalus sanguineus]